MMVEYFQRRSERVYSDVYDLVKNMDCLLLQKSKKLCSAFCEGDDKNDGVFLRKEKQYFGKEKMVKILYKRRKSKFLEKSFAVHFVKQMPDAEGLLA